MHGKPGRTERGRPKERKRARSTAEATVRRRQEERERKKQRLSSQNPKLKRPKGSENSGGQKVDWIAAIGRVKVRPREGRKRKRKTRVSRKEAAAEIEAGGRRKEIADETIR